MMPAWRPLLQRSIARQCSAKFNPPRIGLTPSRLLFSSNAGVRDETEMPVKVHVREATDTLDLVDQLLGVLGSGESSSGEPGFVFFDLDETLVTRDTCLIDGFDSTRALMSGLEAKLGPSSEVLQIIHREMERDYYEAESKLVDPLLARVIRALKIQGHTVFGLTSNSLDLVHSPMILETLAKYKIRFSAPEVRGELPRTGALVMDHPVCRGMIFIDNQQKTSHDKGEVIAEFVSLLLNSGGTLRPSSSSSLGVGTRRDEENRTAAAATIHGDRGTHTVRGGEEAGVSYSASPRRKRKCVLVDNTSRKCERAASSFARVASESLELHTVHFTEAEGQVDSSAALVQLSQILTRLRTQGLIGEDVLADDVAQGPVNEKVPPVVDQTMSKSENEVLLAAKTAIKFNSFPGAPGSTVLRPARSRMGSSAERRGVVPPESDGRSPAW